MSIEVIPYKEYFIEVDYDDLAPSPDECRDDPILIFDHKDFCIKHPDFNPNAIFENGEVVKGYHVFRCYAYIHSGVALSVGNNSRWPDQRWDVSFKGFWLVKRQKGAWRYEQARKIAKGYCEEWNAYLSGQMYYYCITDSEGKNLDSCTGYTDIDNLIKDAKEFINNIKEKEYESCKV